MQYLKISFTGLFRLLLVLLAFGLFAGQARAGETIEHYRLRAKSAFPDAVIVQETALAHAGMILPVDETGEVVADDLPTQFIQVIRNTEAVLKAAGGSADNLVKLNLYMTDAEKVLIIKSALLRMLKGEGGAAVTFIVSPLPLERAVIGADIVFVTDRQYDEVVHLKTPVERVRLAILPQGRAVYISGQLEKGNGAVETAQKTMAGLHRTLKHIGLNASHVVGIKTFLNPMQKAAEVDKAIASFYEAGKVPPVTHVGWKTPDNIEIEMIAFAPDSVKIEGADSSQPVQHFWLPWLSKSPVYCRWTLVNSPRRIYLKETMVDYAKDPTDEGRKALGTVKKILEGTGSDLLHLAKATYYTTDNSISKVFGKVRQEFYAPGHPPAASLARVQGIGRSSQKLAIEMIAVPVATTPAAAAETEVKKEGQSE